MLLALDLGSLTGYAYSMGPLYVADTLDLSPRRHEGGGMRYLTFQRWLNKTNPTEVVYEEVRRHLGTDAAHIYGGLLATLTAWCEQHSVPYKGVPVGTIKKHATGKGNATKDVMVAAARARGWQPKDDNQADALHLLDYWRSHNALG